MSGVDRNSYSSILKSIGLFGGVKVFQILISIVKNKFVAILLGPVGMGITGLITSTTGMVNSLFSFGLHTSSVREIALATKSEDHNKISILITVMRRLVVLTGVLGAVVTFISAPILSQLTFGNHDYVSAFRIVSITLFFDQLSLGQTALMQGTFNYRYMAASNLLGSLIGLCVSIPFYYLWGERAIVPVIVFSSLVHLLLTTYFSHKVKVNKASLSYKQIFNLGKGMLVLGFAIALTGILNSGQAYFLRGFIASVGTLDSVGLYVAGMAIATQYVDVILQAMASDYSPRLAAVSDDNEAFISLINRQIELMLTLVTPLIISFVLFVSPLISLLYSSKFLPIIGMIEWIMLGMFVRTLSWCISFSIVAKGQSKTFLKNEILSKVYSLAFTLLGFYFYGFTGIGVAFCVNYIIYSIHMYLVCKNSYNLELNNISKKKILVNLLLIVICFIAFKLLGYNNSRYILGSILLFLVWGWSLYSINKMIPIKLIFGKLLKERS